MLKYKGKKKGGGEETPPPLFLNKEGGNIIYGKINC